MKKRRPTTAFVPKMVFSGVWASVIPACTHSHRPVESQVIVLAMVAFEDSAAQPQPQPIVLAVVAFDASASPTDASSNTVIDAGPPATDAQAGSVTPEGGRRRRGNHGAHDAGTTQPVEPVRDRFRTYGVANLGFEHRVTNELSTPTQRPR